MVIRARVIDDDGVTSHDDTSFLSVDSESLYMADHLDTTPPYSLLDKEATWTWTHITSPTTFAFHATTTPFASLHV